MRSIALVLVTLALAGGLAACGGSGKKPQTTSTGPSASAQVAEIKTAYEKFFSSKTPLADRVALLQNGSQFRSLFTAFAKNPLAKDTSATVSSVRLRGNSARVAYELKVSGAVVPPGRQAGTAVRQSGTWKVGDASLCRLIALGGTTPSICKHL